MQDDFLRQPAVNQVFTVPNTEEGRYFLYLANKFLNHDSYQLRRRGRTPDTKRIKADHDGRQPYWAHTPLKYAQNFGVYLMAKFENPEGKKVVEVTGIRENINTYYYKRKFFDGYRDSRNLAFINTEIQKLAKMSTQILTTSK